MNVQRYELEIYHCNGGEMLVSETGDYVSHDDYAALEAKCAALAAENAALKESEREFDKTCAEEFGSDWVSELTETQATDAFLAEARAQESKRIYESILDNPAVTDMGSLVDWLEQNANDSVAFAAQLRQEAAQ